MQLLRVRSITIYKLIFVVISKEEGLCIVESLYILIVLDRISTSSNSIKIF